MFSSLFLCVFILLNGADRGRATRPAYSLISNHYSAPKAFTYWSRLGLTPQNASRDFIPIQGEVVHEVVHERDIMPLSVKGIQSAGAGTYSDGAGLILRKQSKAKGYWVFRYQLRGKRRNKGIGDWPSLSLSIARDKAGEFRQMVKQGIDPIDASQSEVRTRNNTPTVAQSINASFEANKAALKGDGANGRWLTPLTLYVIPRLGERLITDIDQNDIADCIRPIWRSKNATAQKALTRLNIAMKYAVAQGHDVNLGVMVSAKVLLGPSGHIVTHHESMPWQEVPAFYEWLGTGNVSRRCLALMVLTGGAGRSTPYRLMRFHEVKGDVWTVPAKNMKGGVGTSEAFRIPLAKSALDLIDTCRHITDGDWVFPNQRGNPISDAAMSKLLRDASIPYKPHGFRSTFRVWMSHQGVPFEIAEAAIAHKVGGKVTQAYLRTDHLDARRTIHNNWAEFITGQTLENVIRLKG